jgi:methionine-S-sulfoxide reductase
MGWLAGLAVFAWLAGPDLTARAAESEGGKMERAIFAGGCFWCMQPAFDRLDGVSGTQVGFTGGSEKNPTYDQVASGRTGHTEAIEVTFDPAKVSYEKLLEVYWRSFDPTDLGGQFADRGPQYRPAIFVANDQQRRVAEASKRALEASGRFDRPIVVPIEDAGAFWPAEDYHQKYYLKNPGHYEAYKQGSGRAGFLKLTWDKPIH